MGDDDSTVIFGAMTVFVTAVALFEFWYVKIKVQDKRFRRAEGFFKYVLRERGRMSWDDIMRKVTADHAGEIDDNVVLEVIASLMKKYSIHDIEKMNPQSGTYDAKAPTSLNNRHATESDESAGINDDLEDDSARRDEEQAEYRALVRVLDEQKHRNHAHAR